MDPDISQQLHEQAFETYNSLKTILPKKLLCILFIKYLPY